MAASDVILYSHCHCGPAAVLNPDDREAALLGLTHSAATASGKQLAVSLAAVHTR